MKKTVLVVLILLFSHHVFAFDDVDSSTQYTDAINSLQQRGILTGNPDGNFEPQKEISRIEWTQMLYKAGIFGNHCPHGGIRFTDTKLRQWYTPALRSAVLCGGITGYKDGSFRPNNPVNYAEAATFLSKGKNPQHGKGTPWYSSGITFLAQKNISLESNIQPDTNITKAQAAFLISHFVEAIPDTTDFSTLSGRDLLAAARKQKGVVNKYDTGYYVGGFPPDDRGACTDVVERAVRTAGYEWKSLIDKDMKANGWAYPSKYDPHINYRRVRNVKVFLDRKATKIPLDAPYLPGDIVTYDQVPGSLWHIAIVSDKKAKDGTPLLIHNYAQGVVEDNKLHSWPAPKTGHYRLGL